MKQLPMGVQALENFANENEILNIKEMYNLRGGDGTNYGTDTDGGDDINDDGSW